MHPARLRLLAGQLAPRVAITEQTFTPSGWDLILACGHTGRCVPHMTPMGDWTCHECGEAAVRASPRYAHEFIKGED
jgi:hypothetical protein